jgi:hypothetical protein
MGLEQFEIFLHNVDNESEIQSSEDLGNDVFGKHAHVIPNNKGMEEFLRLHEKLVIHNCYIIDQMIGQQHNL